MSVLYPLTLRTYYAHSKKGKINFKLRFFVFILIACFSCQAVFAQESKEAQIKREAELKKQEAAELEAKRKINPDMQGVSVLNNGQSTQVQLTEAQEKQLAEQKEAARTAKILSERSKPSYFAGVEYKVITTGNIIEYIVTSAGKEIFKQQINSQGNLYDRQVQAEKEAIYAYSILSRNIKYPIDALLSEIKSLDTNKPAARMGNSTNTQRVTADYTFNGGSGTIPGTGTGESTGSPANPYPATIAVSGVPAGATVKEIKINGLTHTFPDDIDIVLQSPSGTNVILMSDCGSLNSITNVNYTFSDGAGTGLSDAGLNSTGTYKPTNFGTGDVWPAPGPLTAPSALTLSTFGNGNQNGTWSLFIVDDLGGDVGSWTSWSIIFTDPPLVCFPISLTGQPSNATICSGASGTFTVAATPNGVSYNWQVNTGSGFAYITNGGVYSGANTATLTITNPTPAMNGYQYRAVITCPGSIALPEISNPATLTVLTSPAAPIITPSSPSICPGGNVALNASQTTSPTSFSSGAITVPITDFNSVASTINVSGLPAVPLGAISVNFSLTHTFDGDLNINLVAPNGAIFNLVNRRGSSGDNFTNTIVSSASTTSLSTGSTPYTATFAADAAGAVGITPYISTVTAWSGLYSTANGNWTLAISDHGTGDVGTLTSWSITLTPSAAVNAVWSPVTGLFNDAGLTSAYVAGTPQVTVYASPAATTTYSAVITGGACNSLTGTATVTVNAAPSITANPGNGAACVGATKTLSVTATGASLTYQWQVDMGSGFVNITTGTPTNPGGFFYTGQTTSTLNINTVTAVMTGYKYRVLISGACTPATTSGEVTLSVSERPAITITKSAECAPTSLTASGASTYSWAPSTGLSTTTGATVSANPTTNSVYTVTGTGATGCINTAQVDVKFTPPVPVVAPTAPIICSTAVQQLSITSSSLPATPGTTSSGPISLPIDNLLAPAISDLNVSGINGSVQNISVNFNLVHSFDGDIIINLKAPNGNIFNLVNRRGSTGDNFTNTIISSTATLPVSGGTAPFTGTYSADAANAVGIAPNQSNVTAFSSLYGTGNGTWSLIVSDHANGDVGTLTSWSITLFYAAPDAGIWTPATGLFTNAAATTPYVAGTPAATVYASPTSTTTYSVAVTNTSSETRTFSTGGSVTIGAGAPASIAAGPGAPYPSTVAVSGLPANATIKSVTIKGMRHSWPEDVDMLLQSPTGTNVVLMSDAGGSADVTGQNYTFDDAAAGSMGTTLNATGTYKPTNIGASDTYPAPIGTISQAGPALSLFTGNPNGTWSLYIRDQSSSDVGMISSWEITFTTPTATNCTSGPRTVTVTVHIPITFTTQPPAIFTACQNSNVNITAAATGTIQTTQWQVSTNGSGGAGGNWANVGGATSTTLTLTNVQPSQNGYKYRLVLTNAGCGSVNSNETTLTVNPKPTVGLTLNPASQTQLAPGMQTTVTVTSTPAGTNYTWFVNGISQPSITGSSYVVDAYHLGTYRVRVTTANGCDSITAPITFTALPTSNLYVYPNPSNGTFTVTYYVPQIGSPVTMRLIDMNGRILVERPDIITAPYTRFEFSNERLAAGVYLIEFLNFNGRRLEAKQIVITR